MKQILAGVPRKIADEENVVGIVAKSRRILHSVHWEASSTGWSLHLREARRRCWHLLLLKVVARLHLRYTKHGIVAWGSWTLGYFVPKLHDPLNELLFLLDFFVLDQVADLHWYPGDDILSSYLGDQVALCLAKAEAEGLAKQYLVL